jgi:hypothetical protein
VGGGRSRIQEWERERSGVGAGTQRVGEKMKSPTVPLFSISSGTTRMACLHPLHTQSSSPSPTPAATLPAGSLAGLRSIGG